MSIPERRPGTPRVLVIGAGLGGISAAITLASRGLLVDVFEKNDRIGGKMNLHQADGFTFDLGPSIFILPHLYERLFKRARRSMSDYLELQRLEPQWRAFFPTGRRIDLYGDMRMMEQELARLGPKAAGYWEYVEYSRRLWKFAEVAYLENGADRAWDIMRGHGLREILRGTDPLHSMNGGSSRFINDCNLRDMLNFFIKYVGSSPYDAPALMNLLAYSQLGYGLWYVRGGMYNFARACERLMEKLLIEVHLNSEVARISTQGGHATGIVLKDGTEVRGEAVVSNMEVIPAYKRLLGIENRVVRDYERRFRPACSGLVVHLGVDRKYEQLQHHNFFFSKNPKRHFDTIHHRKQLPEDPTIYLVCPTRTDPTLAPAGHDVIKILPHIPCVQDPPFSPRQYAALKERLYEKLESMGLVGLRRHIVTEHVLTPEDIARMYYSNRGAIYGIAADRRRNFALKAPKRSEIVQGLYFVGGTVNPGGGTPMVVLCGQLVGDMVADELAKSPLSQDRTARSASDRPGRDR